MKRNIMMMGGKTYIISLPAPWIKKYGIKKGDELDVLEEGSRVVVESGKNVKQIARKKINTTGLSPLVYRTLIRAYTEGFDEIELRFDNQKDIAKLESVLNVLIGLEIVKQEKNYCILKIISESSTQDFESIFRRLFYIIELIGGELLIAIKNNDKHALNEMLTKELNVNKFSYYALRLLNKYGYKGSGKIQIYAYILEQLERIGDIYSELAKFLLENNLKFKKDIVDSIEQLNILFKKCHEATFNLTKENAIAISLLHEQIKSNLNKSLKTKSVEELRIILCLRELRFDTISILGIQLSMIKDI